MNRRLDSTLYAKALRDLKKLHEDEFHVILAKLYKENGLEKPLPMNRAQKKEEALLKILDYFREIQEIPFEERMSMHDACSYLEMGFESFRTGVAELIARGVLVRYKTGYDTMRYVNVAPIPGRFSV